MTTFHRKPANTLATHGPSRARRWRTCLTGALLMALAIAGSAGAQEDKPYLPTPASQRAPTAAEEAAMRHRLDQEAMAERTQAGLSSAEREYQGMLALGLNPNDPVALNAYRAEIESNPDAVTASDDFVLNTTWGNGGLNEDRYASSDAGTYRGIKAARLSTGELVVIGEVQTSPSSPRQLGLTKRKTDGSRATWTGVDPRYSQYGGQYLIYPSSNAAAPPVYRVHDVRVSNDKIYVLVTGHLASPNIYAPNVLCFNANGSACGWWFAYSNDSSATNDAVAMDIYGDYLVVLGRHSFSPSGGFWTAKWKINGGGGLDDLAVTGFPTPGGYDRSQPADIAFRRLGLLSPLGSPSYYVLFSKKWSADASNEDVDPCLFAVKSDNSPDTSFGSAGGSLCATFDEPESTRKDRAVALSTNGWTTFSGGTLVSHEGVQVVVNVARKTKDGIGVWELLDRVNHPRFGATGGPAGVHARGAGRVVFGGCGASEGEGCFNPIRGSALHVAMDIAAIGTDMGVVGYRYGGGLIGSGDRESTMLVSVQGDSGEVRQFSTFPSGLSEGRFNSLVLRSSHDIIGIGEAIDSSISSADARTQIMTGLTNDSSIFKNGFD